MIDGSAPMTPTDSSGEDATPLSSRSSDGILLALPSPTTNPGFASVSVNDDDDDDSDYQLRQPAHATLPSQPAQELPKRTSSFSSSAKSQHHSNKRSDVVQPIQDPEDRPIQMISSSPIAPIEDREPSGTDSSAAERPSISVRVRHRVSSADRALRNFLHLLKPTTPVLDSQIYMTAGALTVSILLVAISILFRFEILALTDMNGGLLCGSVGTLAMCAIIIVSFVCKRYYQTRHMHILLVNLALCEFLLALSFILEPVWKNVDAGVGDHRSCTWLSTVREYLIMCSTVWTTCMAVDLYYLMTDPFTSPRVNRRKYRAISNLIATLAAAVMGFSNAFDAPVAVGNFCWVGAKREAQNDAHLASSLSIWLFIITPVVVSLGINIYVTFASYNRFREGMAATLQNRHVLLREGFLTTVTFIVYSALLWGVYAGYWLASADSTTSEILSVLFAFLLSYRGSVVFILWCLYKKPSKGTIYNNEGETVRGRVYRVASTRNNNNHSNEEDEDDSTDEASEEAVRPQMNLALLDELVQFTTQGIGRATRLAPRTSASGVPVMPTPAATATESATATGPSTSNAHTFVLRSAKSRWSAWNEIKFTDFYPATFARLRASFGIQDDAFLQSLAKCTTPKVSEGASGSFMFYSRDRSFIVKSLTSGESAFLHSILDKYVAYMTAHPHTFLTRFLGSYCIQLYSTRAFFVVMENVFDVQHGVSIHQRYDIKGSWIDRNAQKPTQGAEVTCRHCNLTFRHGARGRNICPNRAGSHEPNVVLKDMDLSTKLRFGPVEGKRLKRQLKSDSDFLCELGIMDYSLLLGVIEVSYQVNQQNILTRDGSVFLDQIIVPTNDHVSITSSGNAGGSSSTTGQRIKQSSQCLRTSEVVIGPGFYYIGIIDILQTWTFAKRLERFIKSVVMRKDPEGISAMAPKPYRTRFHKKLDEIIHLGHNVVATPKNSTPSMFTESETAVAGDGTHHQQQHRMTHILRGVATPGPQKMMLDADSATALHALAGQVRSSQ